MVPLMPLNNPEIFQKSVEEAKNHAKKLGVPFDQQGGTIEENKEETKVLGHKFCNLPWTRLSIQPDGNAYPCPLSTVIIGNIFEEKVEDIWNGSKLAEFRRGVNSINKPNNDCKFCTHCRHRNNLDRAANDFSKKNEYVAGMKRI